MSLLRLPDQRIIFLRRDSSIYRVCRNPVRPFAEYRYIIDNQGKPSMGFVNPACVQPDRTNAERKYGISDLFATVRRCDRCFILLLFSHSVWPPEPGLLNGQVEID